MPPMTLPNMMPTRGTITASLNRIRWMNHTKIQVPRTAVAKANSARLHRVDCGMNSSASRMPNWADEMVAPVVGETNLLLQSCCIISPATLMPTPVHKMASRRGRRDARKIFHCSASPPARLSRSRSMTPMNRENRARISSATARMSVVKCFLIMISPSLWS